jgi:type VI secretion system FHA domain protein
MMTLLLTIRNVDALENGEATTLKLARHGAVIGRSPHADWSLPDPKNHISSRHCEISYRDGAYLLSDRSTNGTYVNGSSARLTTPHPLSSGDVIAVGRYEIAVQAESEPDRARQAAPEPLRSEGWGTWDEPAPLPARPSSGWSETPKAAITGHGPMSQNWAPPRVEAPAAVDLAWGVAPPPSTPPSAWSSEPREPAPPSASDIWGKLASDNQIDWSRGGFAAAAPPDAGWIPPQAAPRPPEAEPVRPAAAPSPGPTTAAAPSDGWGAFLAATGLDGSQLKSAPAETLAAAGGVLRQLINGLVLIVEARARAKAQLGVQATAFEPEGNNPLKFIRSPEQALLRLLEPAERGFMPAPVAVEDAFRDIQAHQLATLTAMRGGLAASLQLVSPATIRKRRKRLGFLERLLPGAREAALWRAYEQAFEGVVRGADEAFMDVFAKEFRTAYEQQVAEMKSHRREAL